MEKKVKQNKYSDIDTLLENNSSEEKTNQLSDSSENENTTTVRTSGGNETGDPLSVKKDDISKLEKKESEQQKQQEESRWYILKIVLASAAVMILLFLVFIKVMYRVEQRTVPSGTSTISESQDPVEIPDDINSAELTHHRSITQDFEPVTVEGDFYKLTVKPGNELVEKDIHGYYLTLVVENRSKAANIQFCVDSLYLDGFRVLPKSNWSLEKGEKGEYPLLVEEEDIKNLGQGPYTSLALYYSVYDPDHDVRNPLDRYCVNIYPLGKEKLEKYLRKEGPTDVVLYDTEDLQLTCIGTDRDDDYHYLNFYLENRSGKGMSCILDGFEMDGSEIGGIYDSKILHAGCSTEFALSFPESEFWEIHLSEMEKISFCFYVEDEEQELLVDDEILSFKPVKRKVSHPNK